MDDLGAVAQGAGRGLDRRRLLVRTGLALGASAFAGPSATGADETPDVLAPSDWAGVRAEFALAPGLIHMAGFYLASHPRPVREAIESHRRGLDADPIGYYQANNVPRLVAVLRAAGDYLGVAPTDVALTDSTTMGLGLLYGGIDLRPDQEILTTVHDHYATAASLALRAERTGATVRSIPLYRDLATVSVDELVATLTEVLGHDVEHVRLEDEQVAAALRQAGLPDWDVDGLVEMWEHLYRAGAASVVTPDVEAVLGRPATTFRRFAEDHRDVLAAG